MTAYVIGLIDVGNDVLMPEYRARVEPTIAAHGGRRVLAGDVADVLEGDVGATAAVVLEFTDVEAARAWFDSPEYRELRRFRADIGVAYHLLVQAAARTQPDRTD